ncbi:hypothetical protein WJX79_002730 [Trebouxia sp. C0005]
MGRHCFAARVTSKCANSHHALAQNLLVAAAAADSDTAWMSREIPVPFLTYYQADTHSGSAAAPSHTFVPGANEAGAYLTFIAEYYDCLPEVTLFAHAHRKSNWHSVYSLPSNTRHVRWDKVPGFAIMHQKGIWQEMYVSNTTHNLEGALHNMTDNRCNEILNNTGYWMQAVDKYREGDNVAWLWDTLFIREGMGQVPEMWKSSMSGEFFVTKHRIRAHPRSFYTKLLSIIHDNPPSQARGGFDPGLHHVLNYEEENAASKQPLDASSGLLHLQTTLLALQQSAHPHPG